MLLGTVTQQSTEARRYLVDFGKNRLRTGDYIASAVVAATSVPVDATALTMSTSLIENTQGDATTVTSYYVYISGGDDDAVYNVTLTTTLNDPLVVWEDEIVIEVEDI